MENRKDRVLHVPHEAREILDNLFLATDIDCVTLWKRDGAKREFCRNVDAVESVENKNTDLTLKEAVEFIMAVLQQDQFTAPKERRDKIAEATAVLVGFFRALRKDLTGQDAPVPICKFF